MKKLPRVFPRKPIIGKSSQRNSVESEVSSLHKEVTPEGGVIRLEKWPEGYALWYNGKIVFRSWCETADFSAKNPAQFDNRAVINFSYSMRLKLAAKRLQGRGGWQDKERCSNEYLSRLLREHVEKGDPVDVANFCMMLDQRHERIAPAPAQEPVGWHIPGWPAITKDKDVTDRWVLGNPSNIIEPVYATPPNQSARIAALEAALTRTTDILEEWSRYHSEEMTCDIAAAIHEARATLAARAMEGNADA
ncbi:hypothetical protein ACQZ44_12655 [Agrobacterium vitis]